MECALAHSCAQRSCSTKKAPTPNRNESLYSLNHLYDILTYAFPVTEENPAQLTRHPASMLLVSAHTCRRLSETFIRSYCLCLRLYPLCNHSTKTLVCQPLKSKIPCFVYRGFLSFLYMDNEAKLMLMPVCSLAEYLL